MKILILSDTHIGDPRLKCSKKISDLVSNGLFDKIILNGDFIDMWLNGESKAVDNEIVIALNRTSSDVIWVRGNHDFNLDIKKYIPGCFSTDVFCYETDNHRIGILHGHQVYFHNNMTWYEKAYVRLDAWLYKISYGLINLQNLTKTKFCKRRATNKRKKIAKYFGRYFDTIVMGHTHIQTYEQCEDIDIFDNGSTMLSGNYIVIDNDKITLKTLED